jgi:hypothetical protein
MSKKHKPIALEDGDVVCWKHEDEVDGLGPVGPVVVVRGDERLNYQDSDMVSAISKQPYPEWFSRREASQLAERHGLEFKES